MAQSATPQWLTQSQAAKAVGVAPTTIRRYRKNGKLSSEPDGSGGFRINAAELARAFPDWHPDDTGDMAQSAPPVSRSDVPSSPTIDGQVAALREMIEELRRDKVDLQSRLDRAETHAQTLSLTIANHPTGKNDNCPPERSSSFFGRLFGDRSPRS